jgi:hypothetical protein
LEADLACQPASQGLATQLAVRTLVVIGRPIRASLCLGVGIAVVLEHLLKCFYHPFSDLLKASTFWS